MPHCPTCHNQAERGATQCGVCNASFQKPAFRALESRLSQAQENSLKAHAAVPITLGIVGIGGAAVGLIALVSGLVAIRAVPSLGTLAVLALGVALYAFSAYCGAIALQKRHGWLRMNFALWAIQIPVITSPVLSYTFATGALAFLWVRPSPLGAGFNFFLGSNFAINLFTPGVSMFGLNALALGVALYLRRLERSAA
jgi:hypothetical protein